MRGIVSKYFFIFSFFIFFFASCSIFQIQPLQKDELVIYPSPPDSARIQFLTSISNSEDIKGRRSPFATFVLGKEKPVGITRPSAIHTIDGIIYVCDVPINGLEIINLEQKTFTFFIPGGKGELKTPISCFADTSGYLYVVDAGRKEIVVYNINDEYKFVNSFKDSAVFYPTSVSVHDNKIWVTNTPNHQVHVYDKNTDKLLFKFPNVERENEAYLFSPNHICTSGEFVYVTDFGDFRIKIFDLKGNFIRSVGAYGKYFGNFTRPKGIAADKDGLLYAVDAAFENVQIFNKQGHVLMFFGGAGKRPGSMFLPKGITLDYKNKKYFEEYVDPSFKIKYLILVTNQYGPEKINIYGAIEYKNQVDLNE